MVRERVGGEGGGLGLEGKATSTENFRQSNMKIGFILGAGMDRFGVNNVLFIPETKWANYCDRPLVLI